MVKESHTSGPWKKGARIPDEHGVRVESKVGLVAVARAAAGPWAIAEANARLISAAPDLLQALKDIRLTRAYAAGELASAIIDSAIAKAEGK